MTFDNPILFFICSIGVFNGFLASFYFLFFSKEKRTQNLLFGMLLRHKNAALALKLSKLLKPLSIVVFVVIIVIAFSNNIDVFNNYIHYVFAIGVTHNLIALTLGFLVAKMFRLSFKNQKTLAIETGIQNSGLGLLLIFSFFNGLGGMAILAAFWGIWHIVSGLLLAFFWSRKKTIII